VKVRFDTSIVALWVGWDGNVPEERTGGDRRLLPPLVSR